MLAVVAGIGAALVVDGVATIKVQARRQAMPSFGAFFALGLGVVLLFGSGVIALLRLL